MSEEVKGEKKEEKKKGILGKIKDKVIPDHEESAAILSSMVTVSYTHLTLPTTPYV